MFRTDYRWWTSSRSHHLSSELPHRTQTIDEIQITDIGPVDIKGMGHMDLINVTSRLSTPKPSCVF